MGDIRYIGNPRWKQECSYCGDRTIKKGWLMVFNPNTSDAEKIPFICIDCMKEIVESANRILQH